MLISVLPLTACGGEAELQPVVARHPAPAGNWQFTLATRSDNSFPGGVQGGFLFAESGALTGGVTYSVSFRSTGRRPPLSATADQARSPDRSAARAYTRSWLRVLRLSHLTGNPQRRRLDDGQALTHDRWQRVRNRADWVEMERTLRTTLKRTSRAAFTARSNPALKNQDFPVTGILAQGDNIGASNATVTGTLTSKTTMLDDSIGQWPDQRQLGHPPDDCVQRIERRPDWRAARCIQSVACERCPEQQRGGAILQGANGYGVTTKACPGGTLDGDIGNVCLALGRYHQLYQPILLTPAILIFPVQQIGSAPTTQTITVTNNDPSGITLSGLTLSFNPQSGSTSLFGLSDFNGLQISPSRTTAQSPRDRPSPSIRSRAAPSPFRSHRSRVVRGCRRPHSEASLHLFVRIPWSHR